MSALRSPTTGALRDLQALGQSVWLDHTRRALLTSGQLERMVREDGLTGATSNRSALGRAIVGSADYDQALTELRGTSEADAENVCERLAIADLCAAADVLRSVYDDTDAGDGYVSLEVSPDLAHETTGTVAEARRLWAVVDRPNAMIKVPATREGLPAIRQLIADGINVDVTLLFSTAVYEHVVEAYLAGLEHRLRAGGDLFRVVSVASFLVSRLDSAIDPQVNWFLRGKVGVATARVAYARFRDLFRGERWDALSAGGARIQRLRWASTSTVYAGRPDLTYVESLIGRDTVDTIPSATYAAFKDHGTARPELTEGLGAARRVLETLAEEHVDLDEITAALLDDGVRELQRASARLLASVRQRLEAPSSPRASELHARAHAATC